MRKNTLVKKLYNDDLYYCHLYYNDFNFFPLRQRKLSFVIFSILSNLILPSNLTVSAKKDLQ